MGDELDCVAYSDERIHGIDRCKSLLFVNNQWGAALFPLHAHATSAKKSK